MPNFSSSVGDNNKEFDEWNDAAILQNKFYAKLMVISLNFGYIYLGWRIDFVTWNILVIDNIIKLDYKTKF